jgi:hypothetical protein
MSDTITDPFQSFIDQAVSGLDDLLDSQSRQLPQFAGFYGYIHNQVDAFEEVVDSWANLSLQNFGGASQAFAEISPTIKADTAQSFGGMAFPAAPASPSFAFSIPDLGSFLAKLG